MTTAKHVLLVDDSDALAEQLRQRPEFDTTLVGTAAEVLDLVSRRRFDIVLLDTGLPDLDARLLCRQLRDQGLRAPVLLLTAAASDVDIAPQSGADGFVAKPFRLGDLLSRLRALNAPSAGEVLQIGPYNFRPTEKLLVDRGGDKKIRLTEKETAILNYLLRAGDRPTTRESLLNEVWGYNAAVTTHTLETHVYRLRQKIEADPANAAILITQPGGYRLVP